MKLPFIAAVVCAAAAFNAAAQDINPDWPIEGDDPFRHTVVKPDFEAGGLHYCFIPGRDGEVAVMNSCNLVVFHASEPTTFLEALDWTIDGAPAGSIEVPAEVFHDGKPYAVTMAMYGAFAKADGLKRVCLPATVAELRGGVFGGCTALTEAVLPEGITELPEWTFAGCSSLKTIDLRPYSSVGPLSLAGCFALETVATTATPEQINALAGRFATRESIGTDPDFSGSLKSIYVSDAEAAATPAPAFHDAAFTQSEYEGATLYVPAGARAAFASSAFWSRFAKIEEKIYTGIADAAADAADGLVDVFDTTGRRLGTMPAADVASRLAKGLYLLRSASGTRKTAVN